MLSVANALNSQYSGAGVDALNPAGSIEPVPCARLLGMGVLQVLTPKILRYPVLACRLGRGHVVCPPTGHGRASAAGDLLGHSATNPLSLRVTQYGRAHAEGAP